MNARSDRNLQLATIDPDPHVLDQVIIRTDFDIAGLVGKQDLHSARSIDSMKVSDRHGAGYQISASLDPGLTEDTASARCRTEQNGHHCQQGHHQFFHRFQFFN